MNPQTCDECGRPFTPEQWDNRHTDPRDNLGDLHSECCEEIGCPSEDNPAEMEDA